MQTTVRHFTSKIRRDGWLIPLALLNFWGGTVQTLQAYNSPDASEDLSFYLGVGTSIPPIAIPQNFKMGFDINFPLGVLIWSEKPLGLHASWNSSGPLLYLPGSGVVEMISVQMKYEIRSPDGVFLFTPLLGSSLVFNHVIQNCGTAFQMGLVVGWDPADWLRFSSLLIYNLYADGFIAQFTPTLVFRTLTSVGFQVSGNFQLSSSARSAFVLLEKGFHLGLGLDL